MRPSPSVRAPERRQEDRQMLRRYYNESQEYLEDLLHHDEAYHEPFLDLLSQYLPDGARMLDLGCGPGISTRLLAARGYRPIGADISTLFLSASPAQAASRAELPRPDLLAADAAAIPLASCCLDAVVGFEFIEHVTDVAAVLTECTRILKPGGWLIIHSPNLCSPFFPLQDILSLIRGGPGRPVFAEDLGMALRWFATCMGMSISKLLSPRPRFLYRRPDPACHTGGDADSAYLACQIDLARYLSRNHMIVHRVCHARSAMSRIVARLAPPMAPFIGLVAQRPG